MLRLFLIRNFIGLSDRVRERFSLASPEAS